MHSLRAAQWGLSGVPLGGHIVYKYILHNIIVTCRWCTEVKWGVAYGVIASPRLQGQPSPCPCTLEVLTFDRGGQVIHL